MDIATTFNLTVDLASTKINSISDISTLYCPICSEPFNYRYRNLNCFHVLCYKCIENTENCKICNSLITSIDILHPNEELFICPKGGCRRGFINFSSLSYHIQIYHSSENWIGTELIDKLTKTEYNSSDQLKRSDKQLNMNDNENLKHKLQKKGDLSPLNENFYLSEHTTSASKPTAPPQPANNSTNEDGLDIEDLENLM